MKQAAESSRQDYEAERIPKKRNRALGVSPHATLSQKNATTHSNIRETVFGLRG